MIPQPLPGTLESKLKLKHVLPSLSFGNNKLCWQTNAGLSGEICETTEFWKLKQADGSIRPRRDNSDGPGMTGMNLCRNEAWPGRDGGVRCREKQCLRCHGCSLFRRLHFQIKLFGFRQDIWPIGALVSSSVQWAWYLPYLLPLLALKEKFRWKNILKAPKSHKTCYYFLNIPLPM